MVKPKAKPRKKPAAKKKPQHKSARAKADASMTVSAQMEAAALNAIGATRGRPPAYKVEYAKQAEKLCLLGATDMELADFFGVDVRTISRWMVTKPAFCQASKAGKEALDNRVERSLFQQAVGYEQPAVKIFMPKDAIEPVYAPYREKVQPNVAAAIFWLKNRRKADWREKVDVEHKHTFSLVDLVEMSGLTTSGPAHTSLLTNGPDPQQPDLTALHRVIEHEK
jgi:hypothetical protein